MKLLAAVALVAVSSYAQQQRIVFPDDYTPSACAPAQSCITFTDSQIPSAGPRFLGFNVDARWVEAHSAEMHAAFTAVCHKHATCLATKNNPFTFCDDVLTAEARPTCDRMFPKEKNARDWEQCREYLEVYFLGVDQNAQTIWKKAQACAAKQPAVAHTKPLVITMTPSVVPQDYRGYVSFDAWDPDTHVPVYALITFEQQRIFADANPTGEAATYYPFKLPFKFIHVASAEGHTDAIPPMVTITAAGYPTATFRLPAKIPSLKIEMTPGLPSLHKGANEITITAKDAATGKAIDAAVMLGDDRIAYANQQVTITLKDSGKRPEIWLHPYDNKYGDVVIAPATK